MKKFFIVSNIVLIVAVIILFFLQFGGKQKSTSHHVVTSKDTTGGIHEAQRIAYFEMDSIDDSYKYMKDAKESLIKKNKQVEDQINDLRKEVAAKIQEANQKGPSMSQAEQVAYSKEIDDLTKKNQDKAQRLGQSLSMERDVQLQKVRNKIQQYLKQYAQQQGYSYIVGTNENDNFYYKDSTLDITAELLSALNAEYDKENKSDKSK
ncbi:periplasmic chaperone for outer membrane proteins Skp [Arachidicoccus rhizosphaerae]|uniref:Periplasmic chaperone for outer membrane proteins Skp n=1 Tax=Arachidicoccus rhizosphaerae TaxID=551991 RepID=A0A1H4B551_9BACT|nr:OmpH family outer membrane protein [Arachidicoccus rhizosphaerae]SEA43184.1 periplasmic chaperone for outer membrane proteins Skp [Arachidicoccus rhizosphaerae]